MARAGDVIENPGMGARIVFRRTAAETRGELLSFDFFLRPHKGVASEHLHPKQEERFQVVTGSMCGHLAGEERRVPAGSSATAPPGVPHIWWNDSEGEAHLVVEMRPALSIEVFFETVYGLSRTGRATSNGLPKSMLQMAVLLDAYGDEFLPLSIPTLVRHAMVRGVAPVARLLGYRPSYPEFSEPSQAARA